LRRQPFFLRVVCLLFRNRERKKGAARPGREAHAFGKERSRAGLRGGSARYRELEGRGPSGRSCGGSNFTAEFCWGARPATKTRASDKPDDKCGGDAGPG